MAGVTDECQFVLHPDTVGACHRGILARSYIQFIGFQEPPAPTSDKRAAVLLFRRRGGMAGGMPSSSSLGSVEWEEPPPASKEYQPEFMQARVCIYVQTAWLASLFSKFTMIY